MLSRGRRVTAILAVLLALAGFARLQVQASPPPLKGRPNIILIVLDTVRADAVGRQAGGESSNTPFLDAWARHGLVFTQARSPADLTLRSHFSILTGYPAGAYGSNVDTPQASVVAALNTAGYETLGISANPVVDPALMRSIEPFQTWAKSPWVTPTVLSRELWETAQRHDVQPAPVVPALGLEPIFAKLLTSAEVINDRLRALLSACHPSDGFARPVFLLVNFLDAHEPYFPPRSAGPSDSTLIAHWPRTGDLRRNRPESRPEPVISGEAWSKENVPRWRRASDLNAHDIAFFRSLYDAEVRGLDARLAQTMRILDDAGLLRHAIVVVTSDHGEAFGEQGFLAHALELHGFHLPVLYHVPLLIRGYGLTLKPARRLNDAFSTAALADSFRIWAGLTLAGPDVDAIAVVTASKRPLTAPAPAVTAPNTRTGPAKVHKTAEEKERDQELARRLRSLGYLD
jgi:arylsulfatase A-like enzyme